MMVVLIITRKTLCYNAGHLRSITLTSAINCDMIIKMRREIKIRIWDKTLSRFVSPSSLFVGSDGKISGLDINDCVIQEFTGIKDANDVEIYEGDIVKTFTNGLGEHTYRVKFKAPAFMLASIPNDLEVSEYFIFLDAPTKISVIGNIFQPNEQDTSTL